MLIKDFSHKGYVSYIETALENKFHFISFNDIKKYSDKEKLCLLRHDIDADLKAAYDMAVIESKHGIKSTYFLMLRSPVYNLFGRANHKLVEKILSLGHFVGLHYDEGFYPDNKKPLQELVANEISVIEAMFGRSIKAVSFHQPSEKIISNEITLNGFVNTYDKKATDGFFYLSDSNMVWKGLDPWELFLKPFYNKIQFLVHPMWWVGNGRQSTTELWDKAILDNWNRSLEQIIETERAFGNKRVPGFIK